MHELDNMDASASGNPWYPPECIVVMAWWLLYADHRAVFEVHRNIVCRHIHWWEWRRGIFAYVDRSEDRESSGWVVGIMHVS